MTSVKTIASAGQGALGAACVAVGLFLVAGLGVALIALGALFLVGAWGSR